MQEAEDQENNNVDLDKFLHGADTAPADCGTPMELPPWFDNNKFIAGQKFFYRNLYSLFVCKLAGLISLLTVPSIVRVLAFTKKSGEPSAAFTRYAGTLFHMCEWYNGDLIKPESTAYQSLKTVRARHSAAAMRSKNSGVGMMSQFDMTITQFGFMGFALLSPVKVGMAPTTQEELEGFVHFWRVVGYYLGMEDRYNLCRESVAETRALCRALRDRYLVSSYQHPPEEFDPMSRALISGMKCTIPSLDYESFIRFIKVDLLGLEDVPKMSTYSRFTLGLQRFVQTWLLGVLFLACLFRPLLNANLRLAIFLTKVFPFVAYFRFGREKSQVHIM